MAAPAYRSLAAQSVQASTQAAPVSSPAPAASSSAAQASQAGAPVLLPISLLRVDGDTQRRDSLSEALVEEYSAIMVAAGGWGPFPPAAAVYDGADYWLYRGHHRQAAFLAASAGLAAADVPPVPVVVVTGSRRDAVLLSCAENADHGLRRSVDDKRRAVDLLLADPEWGNWSDGAIARACKVSAPFVGDRRRIMRQTAAVAGDLQAATGAARNYTDRWGNQRTMDTGKIAASNKARGGSSGGSNGGSNAGQGSGSSAGQAGGASVVASSAASSRNIGAALGKCAVCGRSLSDPDHAAAGCGPVCAAKRAAGSAAAGADLDGAQAPAASSGGAAGVVLPGVAAMRSRFMALLDDLADYVGFTGDTAGAELLRRGALAALDKLAGVE